MVLPIPVCVCVCVWGGGGCNALAQVIWYPNSCTCSVPNLGSYLHFTHTKPEDEYTLFTYEVRDDCICFMDLRVSL